MHRRTRQLLPFSFLITFILFYIGFNKWNTIPKKKVIPQWLFISLIDGLLIYSVLTNLKNLSKPENPDSFIALLIFLDLIIPIIVLIFLNIYQSSVFLFKIFSFLFTILLFIFIEKILEKVNIIKYIDWNLGYSVLLWTSITLVSIFFYYFVNYIFSKEGVS
jgi:hypothetical protein